LAERFLVAAAELDKDVARITGDELKHLKTVMRLKAGDAVEVFDGAGRGHEGILTDVDASRALVEVGSPITISKESPVRIVLGQGIPKSDKMDFIIQKATELGIGAVCPLSLARCVVRLEGDAKSKGRQARWQKVAAEAAKQCGRLRVPAVMAPMDLASFIRSIGAFDMFLVPWEEGGQSLRVALGSALGEARYPRDPATATGNQDARGVFMLIGPEGGLTREEIHMCKAAGGKILSLGPRILRTETAGLALISVLQYVWGDVG